MTEHDNTNKGAAFTPWSGQQFILQGDLDCDGVAMKVALILRERKDGSELIEVFQKVGVLFPNDNTATGAPDYTGPLFDNKRLAGWKKQKDNKPYITFDVSDKTMGAPDKTKAEMPHGNGDQAEENNSDNWK